MSTYTQILYQIVFGSKDYSSFITTENGDILFGYIATILKNKSCHPYIVGGVNNHIHIISHIHPTVALSSVVKDIKMASHNMILENSNMFWHFPGWQIGYGGFTYHISAKDSLIRYVENQREHHMGVSYKEELVELLDYHCIDYDNEYLIS